MPYLDDVPYGYLNLQEPDYGYETAGMPYDFASIGRGSTPLEELLSGRPQPIISGLQANEPPMIAQEPRGVRPVGLKDRIIEALMGGTQGDYSQLDQASREKAFRSGVGGLGDVLLAAALAPDARSRARALAGLVPEMGGRFEQSLASAEAARREAEDRDALLRKRAFEEEGMDYTRTQRARSEEEIAEAERSSGEFMENYAGVVTSALASPDLTESERAMAEANWKIISQRYKDAPYRPENIQAVEDFVSKITAKSNMTEEGLAAQARQLALDAAAAGVSVDEMAKQRKDAFGRGVDKEVLELAQKRASIRATEESILSSREQRASERRLEELYKAGELPEGMVVLPGGTVRNAPRAKNAEDPDKELSRRVKEVMDDRIVQSFVGGGMEGPVDNLVAARLLTLGIDAKAGSPLTPENKDLLKRVIMFAGTNRPEGLVGFGEIQNASAKTKGMAEIEAIATRFGVPVAQVLKDHRDRGYTITE